MCYNHPDMFDIEQRSSNALLRLVLEVRSGLQNKIILKFWISVLKMKFVECMNYYDSSDMFSALISLNLISISKYNYYF